VNFVGFIVVQDDHIVCVLAGKNDDLAAVLRGRIHQRASEASYQRIEVGWGKALQVVVECANNLKGAIRVNPTY
jgi:hypothetical protein